MARMGGWCIGISPVRYASLPGRISCQVGGGARWCNVSITSRTRGAMMRFGSITTGPGASGIGKDKWSEGGA